MKSNLIPSEETSRYFSASYLALKDFLKFIRTYPDIIYKILKLGNQKYLTKDFNQFILNNFYEDILNPYSISKEFLYVIEHLYKDLVAQCDNPNDFEQIYKESNLFLLFNNLICINEVKIFFNSIFRNIITKYVNSEQNSKLLFFEINELNIFLKNREHNYKRLNSISDSNQKKEIQKSEVLFSKSMNNIYRMRFNTLENITIESTTDSEDNIEPIQSYEQNEQFATKYLSDLNKNEIKSMIQNNKDNKHIKEYLQYQLNLMNKNDDNFYSNKIMLENIQKSKESEKILYFYQRNFMIVIDIINQIIEQIKSTVNNMPKIMRYILKMLYEILKNKFPHIKNVELYSNLSIILIGVINNCFYNPNYNLLLSDVILSSKIKQNLNIIISIFSKLISLKFYNSEEKSDYSPFNLYFIENIPSIITIYEKIIEYNTPEITISSRKRTKTKIFNFHNNDNSINNSNNVDKKIFYSITICYRVEDITTLLNIIQQNKNIILEEKTSLYPNDKFKIIFEKLKDNKDIFKSLKEKEKLNATINYYILFEIIYSNLLNDFVDSKKYSPFFKLEKLENKTNSKKISRKNGLISCQNALSELLINIPSLESTPIEEKSSNNLKQIIYELTSYIKNKFNIMEYFKDNAIGENENKIPPEWYINSFNDFLDKMDEKYKKKEYEKFFEKFQNNLKNAIDEYKFDILGKLDESINNILKTTNENKYLQSIYEEINTSEKTKEIIKNEIIEVAIIFKYTQKEKYIKLATIQTDEEKNNMDSNKDIKICYNISDFIKNFPDLNEKQKEYDISVFKIEKEINVKEFLDSYLSLIDSTILIKYKEEDKQRMILILQKYICEKIYHKIFPKFIEENDINLSSKIEKLDKIKPAYLYLYNFDYDSMIPIIKNLFNKLEEQRCPSEKLNIINQIFEIIFKITKYVKRDEYSDDDLSNLCEYFLIKIKPEKIYSILEYLDVFGEKTLLNDNNIYIQLIKRSIENLLKTK